ncbi:MAG TPA: PsiF family protein [Afipia sp.]
MFSRIVCVAAVLTLGSPVMMASAQTPAPAAPAAAAPAPSKMKLTAAKIKELRAKWSANKPKMKACRSDAKKKGLDGDDRIFFIEDCMTKS